MAQAVFNHLWQSTVYALAVMAAASLLRGNAPRVRYWLWLTASLKFLVPFSLLVSAGGRVVMPPDTPSMHATTVTRISNYFAPMEVAVRPAHRTGAFIVFQWTTVLAAVWLAGALFVVLRWLWHWYSIRRTMRNAVNVATDFDIRVLSVPSRMEPGIFGIVRPVLLVPAGMMDQLTPEQFEAIVAHERRHVACQDNLTATLHMCVEALFWFHPLVWWIGGRLMEERERDCDEAVLRSGSRARDYAQGIVSVCRQYAESPLACAAGISGADLKKRVREIMSWRGSLPVSPRRKAVLAAAAAVAVSLPFFIGMTRAQSLPPAPAYTYEVASIHRSPADATSSSVRPGPQGGLKAENCSVMTLLTVAYDLRAFQFVDVPSWVWSERFDVSFTPDREEKLPARDAPRAEGEGFYKRNQQRLQAVLRDRFGLVLRAELRTMPVYALTVAKGGTKLVATERQTFPEIRVGNGKVVATDATIKEVVAFLKDATSRPVIDETGLKGAYDFTMTWTPDEAPAGPPEEYRAPADGPSLFTAITEQLGLRLEARKAPAAVFVIEKIEKPSEN
jgi:uncharacterized protein (TIGR03435 family)